MFKRLTQEERVARLMSAKRALKLFEDDHEFYSNEFENNIEHFARLETMYTRRAAEFHERQIVEMLKRTCKAGRVLHSQIWVYDYLGPIEFRFAVSLCKSPPITVLEQRIMLHSDLMSRGKLTRNDVNEWQATLPLAVKGLTLQSMRGLKRLAESEAEREKRQKRY